MANGTDSATGQQIDFSKYADATTPPTSISKRAQHRQQKSKETAPVIDFSRYAEPSPPPSSTAATSPSASDDRTGWTYGSTGFESYQPAPVTQGLVSPEDAARLASRVQSGRSIGAWRDDLNRAYREISSIAAKPVTPSYTAEQHARDMESQIARVHQIAQVIGQDETMGRIISGASSPAGLGMFLLSFINRPAAAITGLGMSASQLGSRQPHESSADYLERVLLGLSGVAGSAALGASWAKDVIPTTETLRVKFQETLGAGPRVTGQIAERLEKAQAVHAGKVREVIRRYADDVAKHEKQEAQLQVKHEAEIEELEKRYADDVTKRDAEITKNQAAYEKKLAAAQKAGRDLARRKAITQLQDAHARAIVDNVKEVYRSVKEALDARWEANRKTVGNDYPIKGLGAIQTAIEEGRAKLAGVPDSLKILDQIESRVTQEKEFIDSTTGKDRLQRVPKDEIPYSDARRQFHEIGRQAFAVPDRTTRAVLFSIRDAYDTLLTGVNKAVDKAHGLPPEQQGAAYARLKSDWHQFEQDWNDTSSMRTAGGHEDPLRAIPGSPLAQLVRMSADAPQPVLQLVTGPYGERLLSTLTRYKPEGANVTLPSEMRALAVEGKELPRVKPEATVEPPQPETPSPVARPVAPPRKTPAEAPKLELPEDVEVPNISKEKQALIRDRLATLKMLRPWDWIIVTGGPLLYILGHRMIGTAGIASLGVEKALIGWMDEPRFIEWLAGNSERDLTAMSHLPEDVQAPLREQINQYINEKAAAGKKPQVTKPLMQWLARGTATTGATAKGKEKPTPEALPMPAAMIAP